MSDVYYRSILLVYFGFYILHYFQATRFTGKIIYVNEFVRIFLVRSNRRNRIPLITVVGQILNIITLLIGLFAHRFIDGEIAFQIYKYSIPVFLAVLIIMQELTEKDNSLK
ncbi:hypothetical protein [Clostridium magnum]|uniref:hypothetical protein n=1 Tax=Clostridium magnum TaxID=33954 RepID=UPI0009122A75|nr:hypothetical protein [Clostridium magnum]SHI51854.1 hypothetical protein SAMN02745944_04436 [Clostridium magnum DSM 2767]